MDCNVHIRWMIRRDRAEVMAIEDSCFEFPWMEDDFIRCLRQRNSIGMVAEYQEYVVGFMIYELHKGRLHLLNFAVHPDHQRRGIGSQMVQKLQGKLSVERRKHITTEVRDTNLPAQLFFRQHNFKCVQIVEGCYDDCDDDCYIFKFTHPEIQSLSPKFKNRIKRYTTS